ncbi:hypothetical protein [Marinobacter sp.]|uniref:hypothetical protein n=1 Tax=Marinobacter sp. TaxID=50741 RepID=UPI002B468C94|nr:hypothetical protein [Marinobacter sp.]HKK56645.1 hypothetical protein [Marinobacter sp.]
MITSYTRLKHGGKSHRGRTSVGASGHAGASGQSVRDRTDLELLSRSLTQRGVVVIDEDDTAIAPGESETISANWQTAEVVRTSGLGHHRLLRSPLVIDSVLQGLSRSVDRA